MTFNPDNSGHYHWDGPNPLPRFRNDFVRRAVHDGRVYITPTLPTPQDLQAFFDEARRNRFILVDDVNWSGQNGASGNYAPAYAYKPLDADTALKEYRAAYCEHDHCEQCGKLAWIDLSHVMILSWGCHCDDCMKNIEDKYRHLAGTE